MIYITGDLHGEHDIEKLYPHNFAEGQALCKDDYLVILGDFGLIWSDFSSKEEDEGLSFLENAPWTTLFIDGNHENFPRLRGFPEKEMFGGTVGVISPSIFHLKQRGEIYNIPDVQSGNTYKCWCFGGGKSLDKFTRMDGITWWKEEEPTREECNYGLDTLESAGNSVDFVFTHEAPTTSNVYHLTKYLSLIAETTHFGKWFFGHHHVNQSFIIGGKAYQGLYEDIVRLKLK